MQCPDGSKLWMIGHVAAKCNATLREADEAAEALGIAAVMAINGVALILASDAERIGRYIELKRAGLVPDAASTAAPTPPSFN